MQASQLDYILWIAGFFAELLLVVTLIARKGYRSFPIFTAWISWNVFSDVLLYTLFRDTSSKAYARADFTEFIVESLLELCVLFEIATNVLAPAGRTFPKALSISLGALTTIAGIVGFIFSAHANQATLSHTRMVFVVSSTVAILRLVTFLLIAAFAQVLGLNWRNHVLQIASGLAFYAAISLIATLFQNRLHGGVGYAEHYEELSRMVIISFISAMLYWSFAFLRKEAPRKEFNSKMSEFLISISAFPKQQQSIVARKHR